VIVRPRQRGRAQLDFLVDAGRAMGAARGSGRRAMLDAGHGHDTLPEALADRERVMREAIGDRRAYAAGRLMNEWVARTHGPAAVETFEDMRPDVGPDLEALDRGPSTLAVRPGFVAPPYFAGVDFHRTEGGWDGHPEMGFIHGELIHKRIINRVRPADIFAQRRLAAEAAPRRDYARIFEIGSSSGWYTLALAETFPEAAITGCDLSMAMLRQARRLANGRGLAWRLVQADGTDSGEPDGAYDLVTSFIVLHEVPADVTRALFREAFRLLEPGGDLLMGDLPPLGAGDRLDELMMWAGAADEGGEPWAPDYIELDLAAIARDAGFERVEARGLGPGAYPYVVTGRKPA